MGSVASLCCQCCTKKPRKYNPNNTIETRAASNANYFDHEAENPSKINENTIHVSEIYRSNFDEKNIPSDDPTTSTIFSGMLQQKKDLPQLTNHSTEKKNPSLALPVIPLRSRRSASANRQDEFVHPLQKYSNSCSTIYVDDSTVSQPNWKAMIKCVSIAIHSHIAHRKSNKTMAIFDEKLHPLSKDPVPDYYDQQIPEQKTIYRFMRILFTAAQLTAECAIVTLVYLERVLSYGELDLCPSNWKRIVLGAIMLASKVWDDQAVWNVDFCQILKDMSVNEMNELEREYVQLLQFNVNVGSSIYAKYYFDLRELAKEHKISFADQLLTKEKAIKLEASSIVNNNFQSTNPSSQTTPAILMPVRRSNSTELLYSPRKSLLIIS